MNDGEEDIFEVKYDKALFDQIKKDSELEREKSNITLTIFLQKYPHVV